MSLQIEPILSPESSFTSAYLKKNRALPPHIHTDLTEIFMHLNEKAEQFSFLIHIMQHCPSLYFILFQSCHANKPN